MKGRSRIFLVVLVLIGFVSFGLLMDLAIVSTKVGDAIVVQKLEIGKQASSLDMNQSTVLHYLQLTTTLLLLTIIVFILWLFWRDWCSGGKFLQLYKLYFFCEGDDYASIQSVFGKISYAEMDRLLLWLLANEGSWCWVDVSSQRVGANRASGFLRRDWLVERLRFADLGKMSGGKRGVFLGLTLLIQGKLRYKYNGLPERERLHELLLGLAEQANQMVVCFAFCQVPISEQSVLMEYPRLKQVL